MMLNGKKVKRGGRILCLNPNYGNRCSSQIRQLHVYPCTTSDVSFARSLRSNWENSSLLNISACSSKKHDENMDYGQNSYSSSKAKGTCIMLKKFINQVPTKTYLPPRRSRSSLDVTRGEQKLIPNSGQRKSLMPKANIRTASRRSKVVNSIYDILRQVDNETDFGKIPLKKRRKKWIRTIHDLL